MRLKELREERNLSQMAVALAIKTSQRNISRWENGENEPTANFLIRLADFFGCSIDYLVGREDDFGNISIVSNNAYFSLSEQELLIRFRKLPIDLQNRAGMYIERLTALNEDENL